MAAVLPVIYGIKEIAAEGWTTEYVVSVLVGLVFGRACSSTASAPRRTR